VVANPVRYMTTLVGKAMALAHARFERMAVMMVQMKGRRMRVSLAMVRERKNSDDNIPRSVRYANAQVSGIPRRWSRERAQCRVGKQLG